MKLKQISINCFRNIEGVSIEPGDRFNVIVGKNAQGKTNLLESIYLLGTMKSFRQAKNPELIMFGARSSVIRGIVENNGTIREMSLSIEPSGKKIRLDRKRIGRFAEFFGCMSVVVFSPEDIAMVRGLPEMRRRYLDRAVFTADVGYLSVHHEYYRILKNRNAVLRSGDTSGLDVWTERLVEAGSRLVVKRIGYIREINNLLAEFYATIAQPREQAAAVYRSETSRDRTCPQPDQYGRSLAAALQRKESEDLRRGMTSAGPHRDDIDFFLNGRLLKHHGSQGEQRTFILALKMAEIEYSRRRNGTPPILLLDDMSSELDAERNRNFLRFLKTKEMQVFITTTSLDNIDAAEIENHTVFPVQSGSIVR
jgi:DNA replication and repair protein RecF